MELPETIGLADPREVMKARRAAEKSAPQQPQTTNEPNTPPSAEPAPPSPAEAIQAVEAKIMALLDNEARASMLGFDERTQGDWTKGVCPCGSGKKFARCCGAESPSEIGGEFQKLKDAA